MSKRNTRIVRFSLPADPSTSSVLRMFVRDLAASTNLSSSEVADLLNRVTDAFDNTLIGKHHAEEGRMAFKIHVTPDEITVDIVYREVHFPPAEFVSLS